MPKNITVSHPVTVNGTPRNIGETVSVDDDTAARLIGSGYAQDAAAAPVTERLYGSKTTTQVINNSAVLVDSAGMSLSLLANSSYEVEGFMPYDSPTAADLSVRWTLPSGATMTWLLDAPDVAATAALGSASFDALTQASTKVAGGIGASKVVALMRGRITTGATAGVAQVQVAQATATASATTIAADAYVTARRLG